MFDFFKKKKDPVEESGKLEMNKEMFLSTMKVITDYTQRDVIKIELSNDECSIFDSKFGGLPYLGVDDEVPLSTDNKQLRLLGQINFADLPMNSYQLEAGLLHFWAMDNDLYGLDFENMISQAESRVIYYSSIDKTVSESQILNKYHPEGEGYFPIVDNFKLHFIGGEEGISIGDYHFDGLFTQEWNNLYPNNLISSYYDLPDEILYEDEFNEFSGFGHKMFGYPAFTQEDPRSSEKYDDYILLLQIDSVGIGDKEIMWGDSGICNFFITKKDLENKNFSKVLYNWDCY